MIHEPIIAPAEDIQAEENTPRERRLIRAFWTIGTIAFVLAVAHPFWVAAGMPLPEFVR